MIIRLILCIFSFVVEHCCKPLWLFLSLSSFLPSHPLLPDVPGGTVLCLFRKGSVGKLHEKHNNSAGEALWHPKLPNRCHWRELRDRWVGLPVTAVILLCSQPLCHRLPSPLSLSLSLGWKYEWVTEIFKLQIKDSSGFQEEDRGVCVSVCVSVCVVSHSVDQGHKGLQALLLLSTVGIYKLFGTQQLLYTVNSFSVIPPAMYMGIIWHLL